jgi:hypothetical protein
MSQTISSIRDGDNRYRICTETRTLGWVAKWYQTDTVNQTGVPRFRATIFCGDGTGHYFDSLDAAITFIRRVMIDA